MAQLVHGKCGSSTVVKGSIGVSVITIIANTTGVTPVTVDIGKLDPNYVFECPKCGSVPAEELVVTCSICHQRHPAPDMIVTSNNGIAGKACVPAEPANIRRASFVELLRKFKFEF